MFSVELQGFEVANFQEVTGLAGQNELFEIKEGGLNYKVHKFATRASFGDITLKRGFVNNPLLLYWFQVAAVDSQTYRMNGSIVMKARNGSEVCRFNFYRAFPVKWEGPTFNASASAPAIHSLTICIEWLELLFPGQNPNPPEPPPPAPPAPTPPPPPPSLEGVNFAVNSPVIQPDPNPALDAWAEHLKNNNPTDPIFVTGHTSTSGSASHNKHLSQERANSVKSYLQGKGVTNPITAIGYGEERLKVQTGNGVENGANRRSEINEKENPYAGGGNPWA